jgi:hypothetical protein
VDTVGAVSGSHDKLIADAAKKALEPLGLRRNGQSRLWIGDHGWWLAVVEFQPSGFSKGSYLNVAAHWLWSGQSHISFDLGCGPDGTSRIGGFEACVPEEPFEEAATRLAQVAADGNRELTTRLPSIDAAADLLLSRAATSPLHDGWLTFHAGVAAGLAGRGRDAAAMFRSLTDLRLAGPAAKYIELLSDFDRFKSLARSLIASEREALRLPALSASLFQVR